MSDMAEPEKQATLEEQETQRKRYEGIYSFQAIIKRLKAENKHLLDRLKKAEEGK